MTVPRDRQGNNMLNMSGNNNNNLQLNPNNNNLMNNNVQANSIPLQRYQMTQNPNLTSLNQMTANNQRMNANLQQMQQNRGNLLSQNLVPPNNNNPLNQNMLNQMTANYPLPSNMGHNIGRGGTIMQGGVQNIGNLNSSNNNNPTNIISTNNTTSTNNNNNPNMNNNNMHNFLRTSSGTINSMLTSTSPPLGNSFGVMNNNNLSSSNNNSNNNNPMNNSRSQIPTQLLPYSQSGGLPMYSQAAASLPNIHNIESTSPPNTVNFDVINDFPALGSNRSNTTSDLNKTVDYKLQSKEDFPALGTNTKAAASSSSSTQMSSSSPPSLSSSSQFHSINQFNQSTQRSISPENNPSSRMINNLDPSSSSSNLKRENKYDLMGLLSVIRMTDQNLNTLALGTDLTTLGLNLNSPNPLYVNFISPFAEGARKDMFDFTLPSCYKIPSPIQAMINKINLFSEETLFYIFYSMPKDHFQLLSSLELYRRNWKFHTELQRWMTPINPSSPPTSNENPNNSTSYYVFEPKVWDKVRKDNLVNLNLELFEDEKTVSNFLQLYSNSVNHMNNTNMNNSNLNNNNNHHHHHHHHSNNNVNNNNSLSTSNNNLNNKISVAQ